VLTRMSLNFNVGEPAAIPLPASRLVLLCLVYQCKYFEMLSFAFQANNLL